MTKNSDAISPFGTGVILGILIGLLCGLLIGIARYGLAENYYLTAPIWWL